MTSSEAGAAPRPLELESSTGVHLRGHFWTLGGLARRLLQPPDPPPSQAFRTTVKDPATGRQIVSGLLSRTTGSRRLVILLHGLGGSPASAYMAALAGAAVTRGLAALRLSLRGADGEASDLYHAGLTADLHAALEAPALAAYDQVAVLGFSLGGHVALRYATEAGDRRARAVAAVSAPLDLAVGATAIDRPLMAPYRAYLLRGLRAHGERAWRAGLLAASPERLRRVRTLREWDTVTVARRFGFDGADDYYARASVGPRLGALRCPSVLVAAPGDPMIPPSAIQPAIDAAGRPENLEMRWVERGGHLSFAEGSHLGVGGNGPIGEQILAWVERKLAGGDP